MSEEETVPVSSYEEMVAKFETLRAALEEYDDMRNWQRSDGQWTYDTWSGRGDGFAIAHDALEAVRYGD